MELLQVALDQTSTVAPDMDEFKKVIRGLREKYQRHSQKGKGKGKERAADVPAGDEMNIG